MQCPRCASQLEVSAKFCPNCGHSLPDIINSQKANNEFSASGCLAKTIIMIVIFLAICMALALFVLALPWMLLIGFVLIGLGMLTFFFSGF